MNDENNMPKPRAITPEEIGDQVMRHIANIAHYWAMRPNMTPLEKCNGLAFSFLTMLDGGSGLPSFDLVVRPCEEDKQYHIDNGENWYEDGTAAEGVTHEYYDRYEITKGSS